MISAAALAILVLTVVIYVFARTRAVGTAGGVLRNLHSRPSYHGLFCAMWTLLIGIALLLIGSVASSTYIDSEMSAYVSAKAPDDLAVIQQELIVNDAKAIAEGRVTSTEDALRLDAAKIYSEMAETRQYGVSILAIGGALLAAALTFFQITPAFRARNRSERLVRTLLFVAAAVAIFTTLGIVLSLIGETLLFMDKMEWKVGNFLFGTNWAPLAHAREGFISPDTIGWLPILAGTMMITVIAMLVAVPVGLMAAIYLSDYASPRVRAWAKPMLEILAGIPTVVYGFFAAITVAPFIREAGEAIGLTVSGQSALAAGIVMGIMIIPFISSLSDDVINAVPQSLRDGSYGLGATKAETIRNVILPAALPGIISAVILGVSRAIGETMIVVMAAGQGPNLTWNPLETMTTVTVQIVQLIVGDTEAQLAAGPAFTLGFALFTVTLILNIVALRIVRKYRELYD
ncbi:MAG: phosphate ABC transporter permease subunit PstC [Rhodobacteraceae bacterium]|nr:phosphate ABC transporter permease subunit PstC [Paracoccaceae bacterium]